MWLHSGLFQICSFVAYSIKNMNSVEIDTDTLYRRKTENIKDIINRASILLPKYYLLKREAGNYVEKDYEDNLVVNELRNILKDSRTRLKDTNDTPQKILEINPIEDTLLKRMKKANILNKQLLENLEYFYEDPPITWSTNKQRYRHLPSIDVSNNLAAFVKSLYDKHEILIYKDTSGKMDKGVQRVLKQYNTPYISLFVLKPSYINSQFVISNDDLVSAKYAKGNHEDVLTLNDLEKTEHVNENRNGDNVKGELSKDIYNGTLRGGCTECTKVQIRKCHKALKAATKNSCKIFRCKREMKKSLKRNSKLACVYEYSDEKTSDINCEDVTKSNKTILIINRHRKDGTRSNVTACRSSVSLRELNLRDERPESLWKDHFLLNILRDKYERACEKALYKKCKKACSCAINVTCDSHDCKKKQKKRFNKDCKAQCKAQFVKEQASSEESSDSDLSESESEEDTDETKEDSNE